MDSASEKVPNPFPQDPVAADSAERLADFRRTQCYHEAEDKLDIYREGFFGQKPGVAMGIRGEYGSGKTHLVLQLIDHLTDSNAPLFKCIYSKAEFTDIRDFYVKQFVRKIEFTDLADVVSLHLAKLLRMKGSGDRSSKERTLTQIATDEVATLVASNPQGILDLLKQDLLPVGDLPRELSTEIKEGSKGVATDFFRAYSKLTDHALSPIALRWIQGEQLSIGEKKDLGLESSGINSSNDAREALRFLLGAFKRADYGVMFCLEEFERFVLRGTSLDQQSSYGLLKDLAEVFKATGHVLIVSGVSEAWDNLPSDVVDRIKRIDTIQVSFTEDEARGVLNAYAMTIQQSVDEMFEPNALELLFDVSKLNARRLLSLSHYSFAVAGGTQGGEKITNAHVKEATNRVLSDPTRLDNLDKAVQAVAGAMSLTWRKAGQLDGYSYDFLLGDPENPSVIIEIKKSIFKLGEIQAARTIAASSKVLRLDHPQTRLCVVVVGYSTIEVREQLAKVVDRVFYYDEEKFQSEFQEFLKSAVDSTAAAEERGIQEKDYRNLDKRLDELQQARQSELEQIKAALELLQNQTVRKHEETSEKRRTDKLVEALREFAALLEREEELGISSSASHVSFPDSRTKFDLALKLLDEQRAVIQTITILNENLPNTTKFSRKLEQVLQLTSTAETVWTRAYEMENVWRERTPSVPGATFFLDEHFELSGIRRLFGQRKEILAVLEAMHASRMNAEPRALLSSVFQEIRKLTLPILALWTLTIVGVIFSAYLLSSAWLRERNNIGQYGTLVSSIQQIARQISFETTLPGTERGETLGQALLLNVSGLDALGTLISLPEKLDRISEALAEIRQRSPRIRRTIGKISSPAATSPAASSPVPTRSYEEYQGDADRVVMECGRVQSALTGSSFLVFIPRFLLSNWAFSIALLPLLILIQWLSRQRKMPSRPIDIHSIPIKPKSV